MMSNRSVATQVFLQACLIVQGACAIANAQESESALLHHWHLFALREMAKGKKLDLSGVSIKGQDLLLRKDVVGITVEPNGIWKYSSQGVNGPKAYETKVEGQDDAAALHKILDNNKTFHGLSQHYYKLMHPFDENQ